MIFENYKNKQKEKLYKQHISFMIDREAYPRVA